jgi:ABC-2 type transport system ATP-binding protein
LSLETRAAIQYGSRQFFFLVTCHLSLVTQNMLLSVQEISKRFGKQQALDRVSFSVREGDVMGLIGPNGAGKTTLFECIAGLLAANHGAVAFRNRRLALTRRKEALFYMPDGILPWAEQTVRWALGFFENLYSGSSTKAAALIEPLKLDRLLGARIGTLSKGERKRVLLALGLLTPQPLLMLDEPFDGLDLRQARDVMQLLRAHAAGGRTLLLSIHQLVDAARVCDRLVLLSDGRVVGEGRLDELRAQANLNDGGLEEIFLALT